jgi:adenosylcobinamide amidohydrolase
MADEASFRLEEYPVVCTAGSIDLVQEVDGTEQTTMFVTAGAGTELCPR